MHTNTRKQLLTAAAILCRALAWFPVCILLPSLRAQEGELRFVKAFLDGALIPLDSEKQVLLPAAFVCCMSFIFQLIARAVGQRSRSPGGPGTLRNETQQEEDTRRHQHSKVAGPDPEAAGPPAIHSGRIPQPAGSQSSRRHAEKDISQEEIRIPYGSDGR